MVKGSCLRTCSGGADTHGPAVFLSAFHLPLLSKPSEDPVRSLYLVAQHLTSFKGKIGTHLSGRRDRLLSPRPNTCCQEKRSAMVLFKMLLPCQPRRWPPVHVILSLMASDYNVCRAVSPGGPGFFCWFIGERGRRWLSEGVMRLLLFAKLALVVEEEVRMQHRAARASLGSLVSALSLEHLDRK